MEKVLQERPCVWKRFIPSSVFLGWRRMRRRGKRIRCASVVVAEGPRGFRMPANKVLVVGPGFTCSSAGEFLLPGSKGKALALRTSRKLVASSKLLNNLINIIYGYGYKRTCVKTA